MITGPLGGGYTASHVVSVRTKMPCDCRKRRFKGEGRVVERLLVPKQLAVHVAENETEKPTSEIAAFRCKAVPDTVKGNRIGSPAASCLATEFSAPALLTILARGHLPPKL